MLDNRPIRDRSNNYYFFNVTYKRFSHNLHLNIQRFPENTNQLIILQNIVNRSEQMHLCIYYCRFNIFLLHPYCN